MIDMFKYTDKEIKELLKTMTIICDSREQENSWVTDYFNSKKISYVTGKLDFGDYSCYIPANSEFGITRDIYFDKKIVIERKNSLEELSGTISTRERFESELLRARESKFILMVEETSGWEKIINHKYNTQYNEKAFLATLFTFQNRHGIDINFIDKKYSGLFIFQQLYYFVMEFFK